MCQSYMLQSTASVWNVLICIFALELLITPHFVILNNISLCVCVCVCVCVQARACDISL